jgi:hypothetical protein
MSFSQNKLASIYDLTPIDIGGQSQKNQDFYIDYIFKCIEPKNKFFVEFGAVDGVSLSNTYLLRTEKDWNGLLLDGLYENHSINLHRRFIKKENIISLFEEFNVPKDLDFLSIDIDGMDFYILQELLKNYKPALIQIETNLRFEPDQSFVINYDENWFWDNRSWYGASPLAYKKMTSEYGYVPLIMVFDDLFLIREDLVSDEIKNKPWIEIQPKSNKAIYNDHVGRVGVPQFYFDKNKFSEY